MIAWGARFPAAADGTYYDVLARRIASGAGYTWQWPDGAVTPVAHYPVGYPALLGFGYRVFGASPVVGMVVAALLGTLSVYAAMALLRPYGARAALVGGLLLAFDPVFLTYLPALMTEGVTSSLLLIATALADRARRSATIAWPTLGVLGLLSAALIFLRPQNLLAVPLLAWFASGAALRIPDRRALASVSAVVAITAACVAPWTVRNCRVMDRCALVSVNGGWNLLIGAETSSGAWEPLQTPEDCKTVWSEAGKDSCFERAARREIAAAPIAFLARMPEKLDVTFDYFGAGPWYLHESAPALVDQAAKERLGAIETVFSRLALLVALAAVALARGAFPRARVVVAAIGTPFACMVHAFPAYLALTVAAVPLAIDSALFFGLASTAALTFAVHAVFFGAGRYGLPTAAFVPLAAGALFAEPVREQLRRVARSFTSPGVDAAQVIAGSRAQATEREESPSSEEHDAG